MIGSFDRRDGPALVLLDEDDLHGARGAYDQASDTIYLSRDFVADSHGAPAAVTAVLVEEIGHAIDARVHSVDAPGDEGAIFADFVLGHPPSAAELAALKAENDHGTISVHGKTVAVEFAAPVVGSITLDGSLADWSAADQIDKTLSVSGYDIYAKSTGGSFVFALKAPVAIGANTTAWLNTDQNAATGYKIWGLRRRRVQHQFRRDRHAAPLHRRRRPDAGVGRHGLVRLFGRPQDRRIRGADERARHAPGDQHAVGRQRQHVPADRLFGDAIHRRGAAGALPRRS